MSRSLRQASAIASDSFQQILLPSLGMLGRASDLACPKVCLLKRPARCGDLVADSYRRPRVIVQHSLDLPLIPLLICHPGKMMASVEPLFLACDSEKDDRRREPH